MGHGCPTLLKGEKTMNDTTKPLQRWDVRGKHQPDGKPPDPTRCPNCGAILPPQKSQREAIGPSDAIQTAAGKSNKAARPNAESDQCPNV